MFGRFAIALAVCLALEVSVHFLNIHHREKMDRLFNAGRIDEDTYAPDQIFREFEEAALLGMVSFCAIACVWCRLPVFWKKS